MKAAGLPGDDGTLLEGVAGLVQERVKVLSEVPGMVRFIFEDPPEPKPEDLLPKKGEPAAVLAGLRRLEARLRALAEELGVKLGDLLMPLRVAVTGSKVSPPLVESIQVMGVETARRRTARAIAVLEKGVT